MDNAAAGASGNAALWSFMRLAWTPPCMPTLGPEVIVHRLDKRMRRRAPLQCAAALPPWTNFWF